MAAAADAGADQSGGGGGGDVARVAARDDAQVELLAAQLYRTLEQPGDNPLREAHARLDAAVRAAYGMPLTSIHSPSCSNSISPAPRKKKPARKSHRLDCRCRARNSNSSVSEDCISSTNFLRQVMRYSDERARRSFCPVYLRPHRDRRSGKNWKTTAREALAWCVIKSDLFAHSLFKEICMIVDVKPEVAGSQGDRLQVDTQIGFAGVDLLQIREEGITPPKGGRFDLLLAPKDGNGFLIAIEIKVTYDPGLAEQVYAYIKALCKPQVRRRYRDFCDSYVVTLTPARKEITRAHGHLSWGDIRRLMQRCGDRPIASELLGFAGSLTCAIYRPWTCLLLRPILWSILPGLHHSSRRRRRSLSDLKKKPALRGSFGEPV